MYFCYFSAQSLIFMIKKWVIKSHDYFFLCQSVNEFLFWCVWLTMCIIHRFFSIRNGMLQEYSFKFIQIIQIFVLCSWIWRKNIHLKFKQLLKTIWVKPLIKGKFPHYSYGLITYSLCGPLKHSDLHYIRTVDMTPLIFLYN